MKLSASSHQKIEAFFREYLHDDDFDLPEIYFYAGRFTGFLMRLFKVHGITLSNYILIEPQLISFNLNNQPQLSADLAAHEIAHTLQYRREGFIKFLFKYFSDYRRNLRNLRKFERRNANVRQRAYLEISFEVEARRVAEKFVEWKKSNGEW